MAREWMLLVATVIVCVAPGIHGQAHLSFSADSQVKEISREGCGETRLCIESPDDCDPTDPECLFTSIVHNNNGLDVTLSGQSTGYIAMGFTEIPDEMPSAMFVCAQNNEKNGEFFFFAMLSDSEGNLTPLKKKVNEIRGTVDGNMITCEFHIPQDEMMMDGEEMMMDHVHVLLGSGTAQGQLLDVMTTHLTTDLIDVTDPTSA